jgi:hypothetical protein
MKKIVRLTESDLVRIVKRVINEGMVGSSSPAKYVTQKAHNLRKNGKNVQISAGDVWTQQGFSAEEFDFMTHDKSGVAFFCDPNDRVGNRLGVQKLEQFENSQALSQILRSQFCKGRSFNYDKFPSTECIEALKTGREGFQGCNRK